MTSTNPEADYDAPLKIIGIRSVKPHLNNLTRADVTFECSREPNVFESHCWKDKPGSQHVPLSDYDGSIAAQVTVGKLKDKVLALDEQLAEVHREATQLEGHYQSTVDSITVEASLLNIDI